MSPQHFKRIRARLGLTQAVLAQRLGVAGNTVTRWEIGLHPIPAMAVKLLATLKAEPR